MALSFEWDAGLFSIATADFDDALKVLRESGSRDQSAPSHFANLASRLKAQPGITRREFDRRFRLIVSALALDNPATLQAIAAHLRDTSPAALNAMRSLMPAQMRHLARQSLPAEIEQPEAKQWEATPPEPPSAGTLPAGRFHAVALLGSADEHVRNEAFLRSAGLNPLPLRQEAIEALWALAPTGICGLVVGGSAWREIPAKDQPRAIRRICEYSTFLFVRICVDGLDDTIAARFLDMASQARCGPIDARKFCHGATCDLSPADIQTLQSTARLLDGAATANFYPLGLSEHEAALLRLIAADRLHPEDPLTIRKLGTRELGGGRSGARVFLLSGAPQPFIVKVNDPERLKEEFQNSQRWIADWEPGTTAPALHSHLGAAAISYRLQPAADATGEPAPTLEECLENLRRDETYEADRSKVARGADDLFKAIARAADRLSKLNSCQVPSGNADHRFWLDWPTKAIASHGVDLRLVEGHEHPRMSEMLQDAMAVLTPNLARGVVHGDVHGRNILVVDRLPVFIDFERSGPGHPLEDLVRLDAAVRSIAMRMLVDERSLRSVMTQLYVEGLPADKILESHPMLAASPLTGLAVRTAVQLREIAMKVAEAHSLGLGDFLAMVSVVSSHVLVARSPSSGVERALLAAAGPMIRPE